MAFIITARWPQKDSVSKSVTTVLSQIYLNKLYIPDVLIDIIKDYLYLSAEEILRKFHKSNLNLSITQLSCSVTYFEDIYGRRRTAHWSTGHDFALACVQLQQVMCLTCGEAGTYHANLNGCCRLEFDGEDGTLLLDEIVDENFYEIGADISANEISANEISASDSDANDSDANDFDVHVEDLEGPW